MYSSSLQCLAALLETSVKALTLERQLHAALEILLDVRWLASEQKGSMFLVKELSGDLVLTAQKNLSLPLLTKCARIKPGYSDLCRVHLTDRT